MKLPKKMRCVKILRYGKAENLNYTFSRLPEINDEEVLIEVFAAGVNRPDILQRKGLYIPPAGASSLPGLEVSGKVVLKGRNVRGFKINDKVCALTHGGGYAEYCKVNHNHVLNIPKGFSFIESASIPETFLTVWVNLFKIGKLKKNEIVLIHGGSSGIGTTAIQMAKINGSKVIITAGSQKKIKFCKQLGADLAINYKEKDFYKEILKFTNNCGIDVVLDMIGGRYFEDNIKLLKDKGRHVTIAFLGGKNVILDLQDIIKNRLVLTGSTLRPRTDAEKRRYVASLKKIYWPMLEKNEIKPIIYKTFSLKNTIKAHKLMESSQHIGKIILIINKRRNNE